MSITKRIALLLVLLAAWQVSMVSVQADSECTEACGNTNASCVQDSADARQLCYTQAEWSYDSCYLTANNTATDCILNYYAYCWMLGGCTPMEVQAIQAECYSQYQSATQECASTYSSDTASCNVEEQTANEHCSTAYTACIVSCDSQPTPTP